MATKALIEVKVNGIFYKEQSPAFENQRDAELWLSTMCALKRKLKIRVTDHYIFETETRSAAQK